jgi:hypothetical protein
MKAKPFSCIALQCRGAEKIYEETKNLTIAEELVYWQQQSKELLKRQQARKNQQYAKQA